MRISEKWNLSYFDSKVQLGVTWEMYFENTPIFRPNVIKDCQVHRFLGTK